MQSLKKVEITLPSDMTANTNKIIKQVARERLGAQGLRQKGQSRLWYFSGQYYLILVEFQPSSWGKGTHLNVGLDFNWFPKDYFAFEFGDRLSDFKPMNDEEAFTLEVERLCDLALVKVNQYQLIFTDIKTAAEKLLKFRRDKSNDWENFNLGVLFGLGGNDKQAISYLEKVTDKNFNFDWEVAREKIAKEYIQAIEQGNFLRMVDDVITRTKALKRIA
jgi:hypothetical protein